MTRRTDDPVIGARVGVPLLAAVLSMVACSLLTGPQEPATLLVYNATCDPGPCVPLTVYAFPANEPSTPEGLWTSDIGWAMGAFTCIALPPKLEFVVRNADTGAATTYSWTPNDSLAIGSTFMYESHFAQAPSTVTFLPSKAEGWRVTLPDGGAVTEDNACVPVQN